MQGGICVVIRQVDYMSAGCLQPGVAMLPCVKAESME